MIPLFCVLYFHIVTSLFLFSFIAATRCVCQLHMNLFSASYFSVILLQNYPPTSIVHLQERATSSCSIWAFIPCLVSAILHSLTMTLTILNYSSIFISFASNFFFISSCCVWTVSSISGHIFHSINSSQISSIFHSNFYPVF